MEFNHLRQVEVGQQVATDDHEAFIEMLGRRLDSSGCAKILKRGDVGDMHSELAAVAKIFFDDFWLMKKQQDQVSNAVLLEQGDDMLHDRPVDQRDHRLGHTDGQGVNAGAETARHDNCFQWQLLVRWGAINSLQGCV